MMSQRKCSIMSGIETKRRNEKKVVNCLLYCVPHRMPDYPKRSKFIPTNEYEEAKLEEGRLFKLGSMVLNFVKARRDRKQKRLMLVVINIVG